MSIWKLAAGATALALLGTTPAAADVVVATGNNPQPDENVLLGEESGNLVVGTTNTTGFLVNIVGLEPLDSPSEGQARVATPAPDTGLTDLSFTLDDPLYGFTSLILNFNSSADGSVTFTATDQFNAVFQSSFALDGAGSNFFTLTAINGELFKNISFHSSVDVTDVRQIRLGGVTLVDAPIPEPATWAMMILGFAAIGTQIRRGRSKAVA